MLLKIDHDGPTVVVRREGGYQNAPIGWNLLALFQEDRPQVEWNAGQEVKTMVRETFCVYGQPRDTALENALHATARAESQLAITNQHLADAKKLAAEIEAKRARAESEAVRERKERTEEAERSRLSREAARRLEADMAKLRTALGDLRMKEILGT